MTRRYSSISVQTTLATSISNTALSCAVATGTASTLLGGISLTAGDVDQFKVIFDPDTASAEIMYVTGVTSDTLTIARGKDGTSAVSHTGGAVIKHVLTGEDLTYFTTGVVPTSDLATGLPFPGSTSGTNTLKAPAVTGTVTNTLPATTGTLMSAESVDAATSKVTPVDADEIPLADSAASFGLKKLTWANVKATLKTYFDTLYDATGIAILKSLLTTTGDIIYASAASTAARLGIGTTGQVLTVAGGVPSWATPASGGMTLLSTTAITAAASLTTPSIDQTYKDLIIEIDGAYENSGSSQLLQLNSDASAIYSSAYISATAANTVTVATGATSIPIAGPLRFVAGGGSGSAVIRIPNYASATMQKIVDAVAASGNGVQHFNGSWGAITAVTTVKITWGGVPTAQGNVLVYGVS